MAVALSEYPQIFNDSNLVAYYKLDAGALTTDSKGSFTLTNNNSVLDGTGKFNGAADFGSSNTNKYLSIANNLGINGGSISISLWFNPSAQPATNGFFDICVQYSTGVDVGYIIRYYDNSGTKKLYLQRKKFGDVDQGVDYTQTLTNGIWYNLILTYDTTNIRAYLNGSQIGLATAASGNGVSNVASSFNIGAEPAGPIRATSGLVDEVFVLTRALTSQEILDYYNFTAPGSSPIFFGNTAIA